MMEEQENRSLGFPRPELDRFQNLLNTTMPTKQVEKDARRIEATAQRLPPDLTCLLSSSRQPAALADNMGTQDGGKGVGHKSRKRENKGIKPENVSEVIEARTMRRRGNGVGLCTRCDPDRRLLPPGEL